jgi:propionyl-CoA carboxylase alpha chain
MGDKIMSMRIAQEAGVSCAPRFDGEVDTIEHALEIAKDVGYPVIMKASAGGGGKGMRIAWSEDELAEGFTMAREEAAASFGDDRMLIQRFVCPDGGRHIEIQLVGDSHGNVLALPERECSIQRRNQKVIEESPSLLMTPETRKAMQEQAASLARQVGYTSAGTVEFICDDDGFYFLEMNTRLQVEHPVTELITGVDLVEQMIRVAAGHALPAELLQKDWASLDTMNGWALESRVYAEDPRRNFLPSIGTLTAYEEPVTLPGVRVDSGIVEGSEISMFYDPMISKLCTHGATRDDAIDKMKDALNSYVIRGLNHNVEFLQDLYHHDRFVRGDLSTNFIAEEYPDGFDGIELNDDQLLKMMIIARTIHENNETQAYSVGDHGGPMFATTDQYVPLICSLDDGKRLFEIVDVTENDESQTFEIVELFQDESGSTERSTTSSTITMSNMEPGNQLATATFDNDANFTIQMMGVTDMGYVLGHSGSSCEISFMTPAHYELNKWMLPKPEVDNTKYLLSPMPGALIAVNVEIGDEVQPGQALAVVEAMKMQNILRAEKKSVVKSVSAKTGDVLHVDEIIIEFE